jgi:proline iminopeptidase
MLAMEYALAHQDQMKCLVISNMMASIPAYNAYAKNVLEPKMDQAVLKQILSMEASGQTEQPRYMQLLMPNWYEKHILQRPAAALLRDDAGAQRDGRKRSAGEMGPLC